MALAAQQPQKAIQDALQSQSVLNAVSNSAATEARQEAGADYAQKNQQLDNFLNSQTVRQLLNPTTSQSTSFSSSGPMPGYGTAGGGSLYGTWTPTPATAPAAPMPNLPNPQSASNPIFARAKDTVAHSLTGLMKASRDNFAGRNLSGGTAELNSMGNILLGGNQQLADVARQQAITDTDTANDFAKTQYAGALTGRGQDLQAMDAARSAGLVARGQDMENARASQSQSQSSSTNSLASLMGLINAFKTLY
jgi:hypothetical protein